jgi:hypothetical protein
MFIVTISVLCLVSVSSIISIYTTIYIERGRSVAALVTTLLVSSTMMCMSSISQLVVTVVGLLCFVIRARSGREIWVNNQLHIIEFM